MSMRGQYVVYEGGTLAQGKQAAADIIEADPNLQKKLRDQLLGG